MKVFKRIMTVAAATFTSLLGLQGLCTNATDPIRENSAFATWYNSADLNRNGNIDYADYSILDRFLAGTCYVANNRHMDVDHNNVISQADIFHINARTLGTSSENTVDGYSFGFQPVQTTICYEPNGNQTGCYYRKHIYGVSVSNPNILYGLSMQEASFSSGLDPNFIFGFDSRVPETSSIYTGIVYLGSGGTGFIIGDNLIVTAAHCVYDYDANSIDHNGDWVSEHSFYLSEVLPNGEIGVNTNGTPHYFKEVHIDDGYFSYGDITKDYALIVVDTDLSDCYHFNLGIPYNMYAANTPFGAFNLYVTGYPGDKPWGNNNGFVLHTGNGKLYNDGTPTNIESNMLCHTADTKWGNSGSPVYIKESVTIGKSNETELLTVLAIHTGINTESSGNSNWGVPLTSLRLKFFLDNPNVSYYPIS